MPSTVAWLDTNRDEQRRMREVINLFVETESRDELGIGQVRDSFSDRMFPGTSTLHTRARYLLLIPWCFEAALPRAADGEDLRKRAQINERRLIARLSEAGATDGLIGRNALAALKTLPSALYWSALTQWNVLVGTEQDAVAARGWRPDADEVVDRAPRMWDCLPVPGGFPDTADSLDLSFAEASWIRERMLSGSPGSLLHVLLDRAQDPAILPDRPWSVSIDDPELAQLQTDARLFSLIAQGAALSYNLALAQRYERAELGRLDDPVDRYLTRSAQWKDLLAAERGALKDWDLDRFWSALREHNPRVNPLTQIFVNGCISHFRSGAGPDTPAVLDLVVAREKRQKGSQSRMVNDKLLRAWNGASGTARLDYRWSNVTRLLSDIGEGLARASS